MEINYTEGKWTVNENNQRVMCHDRTIASLQNGCIDSFETKYNAKLIACAPEMLELLIKINKKKTFHQGDFSEIKELIKKATTL